MRLEWKIPILRVRGLNLLIGNHYFWNKNDVQIIEHYLNSLEINPNPHIFRFILSGYKFPGSYFITAFVSLDLFVLFICNKNWWCFKFKNFLISFTSNSVYCAVFVNKFHLCCCDAGIIDVSCS
jgi:hypothetical protein